MFSRPHITMPEIDHVFSKRPARFSTFLATYGTKILVVLAFVVLLVLLIWVCTKKKAEDFKPLPLRYLTEAQTRDLLASDFDGFGKSLNRVNLHACGVVSHQDLLDKWTQSASEFTTEEKEHLQKATQMADYAINTRLSGPLKAQLQAIDWQLAKTVHPYYLDGLPHTRGDVIFVTDKLIGTSDVAQLASTLVHEKVHVWQRKHPQEMQGWMERKLFKPIRRTTDDGLQRSNPDVDGWVYIDSTGELTGVRYASATPHHLNDTNEGYNAKADHPYEQFAYRIQYKVFQK
jgi:hypothetical protein